MEVYTYDNSISYNDINKTINVWYAQWIQWNREKGLAYQFERLYNSWNREKGLAYTIIQWNREKGLVYTMNSMK